MLAKTLALCSTGQEAKIVNHIIVSTSHRETCVEGLHKHQFDTMQPI